MRKTLHRLTTILAVLTLLAWSDLTWAQVEVLTNGDFSEWTDENNPTGWTHVESITQESTILRSSPYSAKHIGGTKDLGQTIDVVGGETYTISLWYYVESGDGSDARIWSFWKSGGTNLDDNAAELRGPDNSYFTSDASWQQYTVTLVAPATADQLYFEVRTYSGATVYWDDFSILLTDEDAPVPTFSPQNEATDIFPSINPTITFNEEIYTSTGTLVDDSNVESLISLTTAAKADVAFTATISEKVITVVPDADLANETVYTLTIQPVQDEVGNLMDAPASASFTTLSATTEAIEVTGDYSATYYAGDDVVVTWNSANIDNVKVEAWVPSIGDWQEMVASEPAANGTATFTIPADALFSESYKIRVSDAADGDPNAESAPIKVRAVATDLATVRTYLAEDQFRYDGEALVTAINSYNGQKYIQDATAAILIYDYNKIITSTYAVGDKMTGVVGEIAVSNNMIRLTPLADPGAPASTGNAVEPTLMTIPDVTADDQAKLIKFEGVSFESPGTFANGQNYTLTDGTNTFILRTDIYNTDYIGEAMPEGNFNVTGVVLQYDTDLQIVARDAADIKEISIDATLSTFALGGQSVLELANVLVADPAADAGAILNIEDFTGFEGIAVTSTDANATIEVELNDVVVEPANYATQVLAEDDVVVVTVTAEDMVTVKYYKVTLISENRELLLSAPAGGETFNTGDDVTFTWTSANIENVNLYAVDPVKKEENLINESPIDATLETYTHTIENGVFGDYIIRIADAADPSFFDQTDTPITITDDDAPEPVVLVPAHQATNVALSFTLSVEFDEEILIGTGNLTINKVSDDTEVVSVAAVDITIDNKMASAEISGLDWDTEYYVTVAAGLFLDLSENPVTGVTNATEWTFTTMEEITSDLFFSEYIEGSSNNKAIEIYNPTAEAVNLDDYRIAQASNGGGWAYYHTFPEGATLAAGEVWVMITDQTSGDLFAAENADEVLSYPSVVHHNGNDARGLEKTFNGTDWVLIDVIGDPNSGIDFDVAGVTAGTKDHTIVRKSNVKVGNTNWAASAGTNDEDSEWIVYDIDTFDYLGDHEVATSAAVPVWGKTINAYPNPFSHTLWLDNVQNARRVVVVNLIGQQVVNLELNGDSRVSLPTEKLPNGVYLLSIEGNDGERTVRKVIKK